MEFAINVKLTECAKPFVKWAGGKGQLLNTFKKYYPVQLLDGLIKRYIEPFVGGGAVLFEILQNYRIDEAFIFDINEDLMNTYIVIKSNVDALMDYLSGLEYRYLKLSKDARKEMYYK